MNLEYTADNGYLKLIDESSNIEIPLFSFLSLEVYCNRTPKELVDTFINAVSRYPEIVKYTYGQTTMLDIIAIMSLIYRTLIKGKYRNLKYLEVGSWFGCSTAFSALALKSFSEDNILFAMDTWQGSPNETQHDIANYENALEHFRSVMKYLKIENQVKPLVCDSILGMEALKDNYFDIIFVDGAHNYKNVYSDILNAIRLVRPGGLIMGHDCECKMEQLPQEIRDIILLNNDPDAIDIYHVGVIKSLNDIFGDAYNVFSQSLVWYKTITSDDKKRVSSLKLDNKNKTIIEMSASILEALSSINKNISAAENKELLILSVKLIDEISNFLNNNLYTFHNRDIKSVTMIMRDYIVNILNALINSSTEIAKKYIEKALELHTEWQKLLLSEIDS